LACPIVSLLVPLLGVATSSEVHLRSPHMSKPSSTVALEIFREVEPLFAQIGRSLEGVSGKTWIRWNKDRPKHQPKPDSISQVARKMWDTIESREGKCIRDLVLATIKRVAPSAPVESWKSAQDCGAWFHNHANEPHAVSHSLPIQKSNAAPANLPSTLANPFTWLDAIDDPDAFFGREKELRKLRDYLRTRSNVQIVGPRRIGKSSLLLAVGHRVKEWLKQPAFAFVDMEMANCHTVKGWLRYVAREWDWPKPPDNLADFADCVGADVRAGRQLVLCLDEFEKFAELPASRGRVEEHIHGFKSRRCRFKKRDGLGVFPFANSDSRANEPGHGIRVRHPLAFQLDGDYLGQRRVVNFTAIKDALRVIC